MVHGKSGMKLEAYKFGLYLIIPITASLTFNEPKVQRWAADYFQFLKYPANPNTNLMEEFEELVKKRDLEKQQRKAYAEQIQKLQESAQQSRIAAAARDADNERSGWFSWMRLRRGRSGATEQTGESTEVEQAIKRT